MSAGGGGGYCSRARAAARLARARASSIIAGVVPVPLRGMGFEYIDFREYVPGDDVRFIDWRLSARSVSAEGDMRLMVREYMVERLVNTVLVVDFSSSMLYGDKYEAAVYSALTVLAAARVYEDIVDLVILSGGGVVVRYMLRPGAAERVIVNTLCSRRPGGRVGLGAVADLSLRLPKRRTVIVVTDYGHRIHEYGRLVEKLGARGLRIGFVFVSTLYELRPPVPGGRYEILDLEEGRGGLYDLESFYRAVSLHVSGVDAVVARSGAPSIRVVGLGDARRKTLGIARVYARARAY